MVFYGWGDGMERPDTIWYRMNRVWQAAAAFGLATGVLFALVIPYAWHISEPPRNWAPSAWAQVPVWVPLTLGVFLAGVVVLGWTELIGRGKHAWLWMTMWVIGGDFLGPLPPIIDKYRWFSDICWTVIILAVMASQIVVGVIATRHAAKRATESDAWYVRRSDAKAVWAIALFLAVMIAILIGQYVYMW